MNKTTSLYNKYRPSNFEQIKGQDQVVNLLQNSISRSLLHHSYLITGIRGVGKTTIARVLAKTINCQNIKENKACNVCDSCISIENGSDLDVIEIDAASNNGIEEIRSLKERANYISNSKYKVFIIDEVHMLSKSAFNAFLKLLEEPPKNVIFILITTEINRIPDTILSRTLILRLNNPSDKTIEENLNYILNSEEIEFDPRITQEISYLSNNSIRDSITILEKVIISSEKKQIKYDDFFIFMNLLDEDDFYRMVHDEDIDSLIVFFTNNQSNLISVINYFFNKVINYLVTGKILSENKILNKIDSLIDLMLLTKDPKIIFNKLVLIFKLEQKLNNNNKTKKKHLINQEETINVRNIIKLENLFESQEKLSKEDEFLQNDSLKSDSRLKSKNKVFKIINQEYRDYVTKEIYYKLVLNIEKNIETTKIFNEIYKTIFLYNTNPDWSKYSLILEKATLITVDDNYMLISFLNEDLYQQYKEIAFDSELQNLISEVFNKNFLIVAIYQRTLIDVKKFIEARMQSNNELFINNLENYNYPNFMSGQENEKEKIKKTLSQIFGQNVEVIKEED